MPRSSRELTLTDASSSSSPLGGRTVRPARSHPAVHPSCSSASATSPETASLESCALKSPMTTTGTSSSDPAFTAAFRTSAIAIAVTARPSFCAVFASMSPLSRAAVQCVLTNPTRPLPLLSAVDALPFTTSRRRRRRRRRRKSIHCTCLPNIAPPWRSLSHRMSVSFP